jgi:hypothetical protein
MNEVTDDAAGDAYLSEARMLGQVMYKIDEACQPGKKPKRSEVLHCDEYTKSPVPGTSYVRIELTMGGEILMDDNPTHKEIMRAIEGYQSGFLRGKKVGKTSLMREIDEALGELRDKYQ